MFPDVFVECVDTTVSTVKVGAVSVFVTKNDTGVACIVVGVETGGSVRVAFSEVFTGEGEFTLIDTAFGFDSSEFHCADSMTEY